MYMTPRETNNVKNSVVFSCSLDNALLVRRIMSSSLSSYYYASNIGVKLPPEKKVPWHRCWALLSSRWKSHFSQKNAFFGQKKAFFQKVHFIQIWSVTPNTIFECIKNDFLLSNPKLVFLTEFNLLISYLISNLTPGSHSDSSAISQFWRYATNYNIRKFNILFIFLE